MAVYSSILKIFEAYKTSSIQPKIQVTPNVFKMILPCLNAVSVGDAASTHEKNVMQYIHQNGSINRKQAEGVLGISQTAAGLVLRELVENGYLVREGRSRNVRYIASSKDQCPKDRP